LNEQKENSLNWPEITSQRIVDAVNSGNAKEIQKLKLIGKKRCSDILQAHEEGFLFTSINDLKHVGLSAVQIKAILEANIGSLMTTAN
jgi:DNA uptake protein ComE-like DNA-binding protein